MKNKAKPFLLLFLACLLFINCDDLNDNPPTESMAVNDFIWRGLNTYYFWQAEVPNLTDDYFYDQKKLNNFLSSYTDPYTLFQDLLNKPIHFYPNPGEAIDRFSVIFSNYTQLEGILSGNTLNNGVDFGLKRKAVGSNEVFGWVRYIIPNSDASNKDIHRGDLFYAVNGIPIYDDGNGNSNWVDLLYNEDTYTLNLADYDNGQITPNGRSVTLTKTSISENPIYMNTVINNGTHKIGYLVYNGFYSNYENQLNAAFANLQSQGITDMVLDLRYNSGGSVATATRLASMITGQFTGQVFIKQQWNPKVTSYYDTKDPSRFYNYFTTTLGNGSGINNLNLNKIYVLTTKSTASASELIINGLAPYLNVIQIGDLTTGKNMGSITLYDSPTFNKKDVNTNHKYAMQPLVFKTVNKVGFGDYTHGLEPNYLLEEDLGNLDVLGSPSEPLLSSAIGIIIGSGKMKKENPTKNFDDIIDTKSINRFKYEMYLNEISENFMDGSR